MNPTSFLFLLLVTVTVVSCQDPPIPTIPQSFQTAYTVSIDIINNGMPIFGGWFALDYVNLGGYWSFEDFASSFVPFTLQSAIIGVPQKMQKLLQGFQFLNPGRCWTIDRLSEEQFHQYALSIPADAVFQGNGTIDGYKVGIWNYNAYYGLVSCSMWVRYGDSAPLKFSFSNSFIIQFTFTLHNTRFSTQVDPDTWSPPVPPCPKHSFGPGPLNSILSLDIPKLVADMYFGRELLHFFDSHHKSVDQIQAPQESKDPRDPTPPTLRQYFSAEFVIGYGTLESKDNFKQPNNIFRGEVSVDKSYGGLYYSLHDNQDANVPWLFSTSFVTSPSPSNVSAYQFLTTGRCWNLGIALNPNVPIRVPADAQFKGYFTAYGQSIELWEFPYAGNWYESTVQLAVNRKNMSILFINGVADLYDYSPVSYIFFETFNTTRPSPSDFVRPPGPCPSVWSS